MQANKYTNKKQVKELIKITFSTTGEPIDPPQSDGDNKKTLMIGTPAQVALRAMGSQQQYLWVCYTSNDTTSIAELNLTYSCTECKYDESTGKCGILPVKPVWIVTRMDLGTCLLQMRLQVTVNIPTVGEEDSGKLILAWSSDSQSPQTHKQLMQTFLHTEKKSPSGGSNSSSVLSVLMGVAAGMMVVLVIIVVVLTLFVTLMKRKRSTESPVVQVEQPFCELSCTSF